MPFKKGEGGRKKGAINKRSREALEIAERMNFCPIEILIHVARADWEALGYESKSRSCWTSAGIEYEEDIIKVEHRVNAAKEVAKYLYPQKKAVELSASDEKGFRVLIEDYTVKKA